MKKLFAAMIALATAACLSACSCPHGKGSRDIAAIVNGEKITIAEIDDAARDHLDRVDTQVYQIRKKMLNELLDERIIARAAKAKGMSAEEFIAHEIDSRVMPPGESEIRAIYDARKDATQQTFEEVKDQIAAHLLNNRRARASAELLARLRSEADVKIKLAPPRVKIDTSDAPATGAGDRVVLVEFSDYQCPFCSRVRDTVWRLMDEYEGRIRYFFMDFPLSFHREAGKAHEAAHCAGEQGGYFEYNKKIFENQQAMQPADLKRYAVELKLDSAKFDECLDSGSQAQKVAEFMARGLRAGVSGTPAFFINGILISGAQPYESFKELIDSELSR